MNWPLLCLDLDGTLLNDEGRLGQVSRRVLEELRSRGHIVTFVTGRAEIDMAHSRDLYRYADYMLMSNGGKLIRSSTGKTLFRTVVPPEQTRALTARCLQEGLQLYVVMGERYAVTKVTPGVEQYAAEIGLRPIELSDPEELPLDRVESFMSGGDGERVERLIRELGLSLRCIPSEPGCCDIMPETTGKWPGICRLAELLKIPTAEILTMGNYDNDIGMLRGAGMGVAVANALKHVQAAADYVTQRTNNEDAMEEVAQRLLGL